MKKLTPKVMRATAATHWQRLGVPAAVVERLLHHSDKNPLAAAYLHHDYGREMRAAVSDYFLDHRSYPGSNPRRSTRAGAGPRWFERQLTLHTDAEGNPAADWTPEHRFGPYLPHGTLVNPVNERSSILLLPSDEGFEPDDSTGWVFFLDRGLLRLNSSSTLRGSSTRFYDL